MSITDYVERLMPIVGGDDSFLAKRAAELYWVQCHLGQLLPITAYTMHRLVACAFFHNPLPGSYSGSGTTKDVLWARLNLEMNAFYKNAERVAKWVGVPLDDFQRMVDAYRDILIDTLAADKNNMRDLTAAAHHIRHAAKSVPLTPTTKTESDIKTSANKESDIKKESNTAAKQLAKQTPSNPQMPAQQSESALNQALVTMDQINRSFEHQIRLNEQTIDKTINQIADYLTPHKPI